MFRHDMQPYGLSQGVIVSEWLDAWPWAKKVAKLEVEAPCATPRAEVWTQAEAKAWEIADVAITNAATRREWELIDRNKEVKAGWGATRLKARLHSRMAQAKVDALALVGVLGWARSEARARRERVPSALPDLSIVRNILSHLNCYEITHHLWHDSHETKDEYECITDFIAPINRLPFELLRQIFLIIIDGVSGLPLLLVCKQWNAIVTSIWAPLYLRTMTPLDVVTRQLERNRWLLDVCMDTDPDRGTWCMYPGSGDFLPIFAAIKACSRWRSLVVESLPDQCALPKALVDYGLQRYTNNPMSSFTTFKIKSTCNTSHSPLLDHLLVILGTAARALITVEINSANVISLLSRSYPSMFHSIKVLSLNTPGIPNPVDLLPHLHQLETFTASHISFPIYRDSVDLPFIHTLRHLHLRAASIQWMDGRAFPVLEDCTLIFPLYCHVLYTFRAALPNCTNLAFQGYPLDILGGILAHKLAHLSVASSGSFNRRGSRQLVWLSSQILGQTRLTPKSLHISIEATNRAWVNALGFMSNLEELVISNARPCSLGAKVLQSLVVQPIILGAISIPGEPGAPLCPLLRRFVLRYRRWLRLSEEFDLISVFESIIQSRQHSNHSLTRFSLWITGYPRGPLELIEESQLSVRGFDHLRELIPGRSDLGTDTRSNMVEGCTIPGIEGLSALYNTC